MYVKEAINESIKLPFLKEGYKICVHNDTSDRFSSMLVTQGTEQEMKKPREDQNHKPLSFRGSEFTNAERKWATYAKKGPPSFKNSINGAI